MLSLTADRSCCAAGATGRRLRSALEWLLPGAVLMLIPKCPLCIIGYVAVFSGVGLSISTASWVRIAMIGTCVVFLVYLSIRALTKSANIMALDLS